MTQVYPREAEKTSINDLSYGNLLPILPDFMTAHMRHDVVRRTAMHPQKKGYSSP